MRPKKTFNVENLRKKVNERNMRSTCDSKIREGWNDILEAVLHETGNYNGFNYLRADRVPTGEKPGIIFDESPSHDHVFPDETRRVYY